MGTVDIFVGNNLIIDFDIFAFWNRGYSVNECKDQILKYDSDAKEVKENIIVKNILDNYNIFSRLEQYLLSPQRLKEQLLFQISDEIVDKLIETYYEYDSAVIREILCHKLTQRQRKDLDDISEKTNVRVKSCRRQFDNLKRIIRTIDEMRGPLIKNITENFCLSTKMAENYAAIVFIARNQFEISKRKLNYLSLEDFVYCANQMIKNWSTISSSDSADTDLNKDFLINLKDLKILSEKEMIDDHKKLVIAALFNKTLYSNQSVNQDSKAYHLIDSNFKDLTKALIEIAYALNHSKDMKDLFVDLIEQFVEPCKENEWTKKEVKIFLEEYRKKAHFLPEICRENPKFLSVFDRYINVISSCILQMYHS